MIIDASGWFYPAIILSVYLSPLVFFVNLILEVFS